MASLLSILVSLKMSKKLQLWFLLLSWRGFHLYDMTQVCWDDRLHNAENRLSKISTDGTDCLICEPTPFCRSWYSHKLNKAALRYEISVAVGCLKVVWVHGPFRAGSWTDIKIFKKGLRQMLHLFGEMTIANGGYQGLDYWVQAKRDPPSDSWNPWFQHACSRKAWNCEQTNQDLRLPQPALEAPSLQAQKCVYGNYMPNQYSDGIWATFWLIYHQEGACRGSKVEDEGAKTSRHDKKATTSIHYYMKLK